MHQLSSNQVGGGGKCCEEEGEKKKHRVQMSYTWKSRGEELPAGHQEPTWSLRREGLVTTMALNPITHLSAAKAEVMAL